MLESFFETIKLRIYNSEFYFNYKRNKFKRDLKLRTKVYKKLGSLIKQSLSIKDIIIEITNIKDMENTPEYFFLKNIQKQMQKGKSFTDSVVGWVSDNELQLIKAGEKSGDLEKSFSMAIKLTTRLKEIKKRIYSEAAYPAILILASLGLLYGLSTNIMPSLTGISNPNDWPSMSKNLYLLSYFVEKNIFYIFLILLSLSSLITYTLPKLTGNIRDRLDSFPPYSTYKVLQSSIFLISLSTLLNAQITLKESILNLKKQANPYVSNKLKVMIKRIDKGETPGKSINTEFMGKAGADIEIYSKAADFEKALLDLGDENMDDTLDVISQSMSLFRVLMLVLIGALVGWVVLSFFEVANTVK